MMANKFKKGDWVRAKANNGWVPDGAVGRVAEDDECPYVDWLNHGRLAVRQEKLDPWLPKVGERVRVAKHVNSLGDKIRFDLPIGSEHTVTKIGNALGDKERPSFSLSGSGVHFYLVENLEPIIDAPVAEQPVDAGGGFKAGDKIELVTGAIQGARAIGDVYEAVAHTRPAHKDSVCFIGKDGEVTWAPGNIFKLHKPLKIEAGKFYKTRDGRKVGPVDTNPDNFNVGMDFFGREAAAVIPEIGDVDASGFWLCGDGNSDHDIIAEWQDAPTTNTAAQVDTIADEYGPVVRDVPVAQQQARFKVGDRVECTLCLGVATVKEVRADERFRVDWDNGDVGVSWWRDSDFTLARRVASPTPAIVCKLDKGQPLPAHRPHVHATVEAADKEAARLAELHKGQEFGVFSLTGTPHRVAKVYEHEWQRLADEGKRADAEAELRRITGMSHSLARHVVSNRAA